MSEPTCGKCKFFDRAQWGECLCKWGDFYGADCEVESPACSGSYVEIEDSLEDVVRDMFAYLSLCTREKTLPFSGEVGDFALRLSALGVEV